MDDLILPEAILNEYLQAVDDPVITEIPPDMRAFAGLAYRVLKLEQKVKEVEEEK